MAEYYTECVMAPTLDWAATINRDIARGNAELDEDAVQQGYSDKEAYLTPEERTKLGIDIELRKLDVFTTLFAALINRGLEDKRER
jgi:hypothetical protein